MRIPDIERQPRAIADTVTHYGYCAFNDIDLSGPGGLEHNVQPSGSPFQQKLPAKMLIPFTNVEMRIIDELAGASNAANFRGTKVVWKTFNKPARECVTEMEDSYAGWGFVNVTPITGYSISDAQDIFDAIQPFEYQLKELLNQLDFDAVERINATEAYEVTYEGETRAFMPLRDDLKGVAEEVRAVLARSASTAFDKAAEVVENTRLSMTSAFAGGAGKKRPDPLDKYLYAQIDEEMPTLLTSEKKGSEIAELANVMKTNNQSSDALKLREIELREREIDLREREVALLEKQQNKEKMEKVRAAKEV